MSPALPSHEALRAASEWFALLRSGAASDRDRAAWDRWLGETDDHRRAWRCMEQIGARFDPLQAAPARPAAAALLAARGQSRRRLLLGAALAPATGLAAWLAIRGTSTAAWAVAWRADYRSATGEIRELMLADGTQVWLNTASAIDVRLDDTLRRIDLLAGEIFVRTAADARGRPLLVDTSHASLKTPDAYFTVRCDDDASLVSVYQGTVEARCRQSGDTRRIAAGSQARILANRIAPTRPADPAREAWTRGVLLSADLPLGELAAELERYMPGHLRVAPEVAALRVLGSYPLLHPSRTLAMLEAVLPIRVSRPLPWWTTIEARTAG